MIILLQKNVLLFSSKNAFLLQRKESMAGSALTSKNVVSGNQPWTTKRMSTVGQIGHGIAIAQGIREAAPVVMGAMRTAGSFLPILGVL